MKNNNRTIYNGIWKFNPLDGVTRKNNPSFNSLLRCFSVFGFILFMNNSTLAQNYYVSSSIDAGNPGGTVFTEGSSTGWFDTGLPASLSANEWSPTITLPFPFDFFGVPMTSFKVSANGLLTFDVAFAGTPPNNNNSLPDASLPDNTIAVFWDEFTASPPTGTNDKVYYQVFGSAPNRQLWIYWYSFEFGNPAVSFQNSAAVLQETTNNVYVVDVYGGSTPLSATVGLQMDSNVGLDVGNTIQQSGNGSLNSDNDYWEFSTSACSIAITGTDTRTECNSYTWIDGNTYNSSNNSATYNIVAGAANGCDSLVTLDLTIINTATGTDTRTECNSYTWIDGNTYNSSNNSATYNIVAGAANGCDSLVTLDLTIINTATGTDTRTECNSYTWIDGNTYNSSNNSATYNIVAGAANGCDSLVTLDLTINSVSDVTTSTNGTTITANNAAATYQWLDCDANYSIISGETASSFTAALNGNYAVELNENGCFDTTSCIAITEAGIIENNFGNELTVYPNPTYGNFSIDLGSVYETTKILITDISGRFIQSKSFYQTQFLDFSISEPSGIYILKLETENKKAVIRLVNE